MKPTLYPNGFPSAYEELKTFYPVFYRDVFEMDAIWRAAGGGLDEIEDGVDAVVNNNFVSLMDTDALAQMETFLGIPLNQKRTLEARRKLVASYFIGGNHIGAREIKDITRAFTEGTCEVSFVGGTVYIHVKSDIKDTPPEDDYYYILRKKIPAHLGVYTKAPLESPSLNFPLQVYTPRQINVNHTNAKQNVALFFREDERTQHHER